MREVKCKICGLLWSDTYKINTWRCPFCNSTDGFDVTFVPDIDRPKRNYVDYSFYSGTSESRNEFMIKRASIKRVIYSPPATIVFWNDGTKTVVKCDPNDTYDKEKGLLLCMVKRMLGNKSNYNNTLRKWLEDGTDEMPI
jgi:hypothetical protein